MSEEQEDKIASLGMSQPGADDDGQWYKSKFA